MKRHKNKERGMALVVVLMLIGGLTAVLVTSMERTTADISMAGTWRRASQAEDVAETGLYQVARQVLEEYKAQETINGLLGSIQFGTSSGGQYAVIVADNDNVGGEDQDGDGSPTTDADQVFRLLSTGAIGTNERLVEAFFRVTTSNGNSPPSSEGIGALGLCADNVDIANAGNINGDDFAAAPYPCSGASCRTSTTGAPSAAGMSYNTGSSVSMTGVPTGSPAVNSNAGVDCNAWQAFVDAASGIATKTYSAADGPFNGSSEAAYFGSDVDPKIILVEGVSGETAQFNGNLNGNGILIIKNASVVFNGTFAFNGLVLIVDDGGGISLSGTSNLYGSVMVLSSTTSDSQVEIGTTGNKDNIKYSTEGLGRASDAFTNLGGGGGTSLELLAWRPSEN